MCVVGFVPPPPPPPPPPELAQPDKPVATRRSIANIVSKRLLLRVAMGSSNNPHASETALQVNPNGAGPAIAEVWLVVIFTVSVPVALPATELLEGLKTQAAYDGSELHWKVKVAGPPVGVSVRA